MVRCSVINCHYNKNYECHHNKKQEESKDLWDDDTVQMYIACKNFVPRDELF